MKAILSVFDKHGIDGFARRLAELGWELFSTGNTKAAIAAAGVPVRSISDLTGFPEILDGRVKTLHPAVHGGLLARRDNPADMATLAEHGLGAIDLVCVNLYPFTSAIERPGATQADALENIDIGGPTMLRAAAKNFPSVLVVCDPDDYAAIGDSLQAGRVDEPARRALAAKAFQHVAAYDTAISAYLRSPDDRYPSTISFAFDRVQPLRYGENPHQDAAFYRDATILPGVAAIAAARQIHGAALSYNNILDADAALGCVAEFGPPAAVVVKHTNPCGVAVRDTLLEAYLRAFEGDTVSAFGGIVAINRELDEATARELGKTFYEIVIAPSYSPGALAVLTKKKNLRLLEMPGWAPEAASPVSGDGWDARVAAADSASAPARMSAWTGVDLRRVTGGVLVQARDAGVAIPALTLMTKREPSESELRDLLFAWRAARHVKSNAIVFARGLELVGMGAGQPNRVTSVQLAAAKAGEKAKGAAMASDAFFPFADGVEAAIAAGVTAIIQPGGSIRDAEVVAAADTAGVAMVATGMRHFRH